MHEPFVLNVDRMNENQARPFNIHTMFMYESCVVAHIDTAVGCRPFNTSTDLCVVECWCEGGKSHVCVVVSDTFIVNEPHEIHARLKPFQRFPQ